MPFSKKPTSGSRSGGNPDRRKRPASSSSQDQNMTRRMAPGASGNPPPVRDDACRTDANVFTAPADSRPSGSRSLDPPGASGAYGNC